MDIIERHQTTIVGVDGRRRHGRRTQSVALSHKATDNCARPRYIDLYDYREEILNGILEFQSEIHSRRQRIETGLRGFDK